MLENQEMFMRRVLSPRLKYSLMLAVVIATVVSATAGAAPIPAIHALEGVRIVVSPGQVIDAGTVVIRDGIIEAAGADVATPADAKVHNLEGMTVYPGLIDAYSVAPWPDEDEDAAPQGTHENALVRPERDMAVHAVQESRFKKLRGAGITTAVVAPQPGLLRGTSVLVNLGEGSAHENLLRTGVAQNATLRTSAEGGYPNSLMGAEALFRQTLLDARWYAKAQEAYAANGSQKRPVHNRALAALGDVAMGQAPIMLETEDVLGTLRWAHLIDEFGLDAWLIGNGEEYKRLDDIVAHAAAAKAVHIVPVEFPDAPDVGSEGNALDVTLETLRHWDRAPDNPAKLLAAGLTVAFTSLGLNDPADLHDHLATAIERGLDPDAALAAFTTTPAKLLGISDRAGTVEAGKMANLVIVEGDLFAASTKIATVWVDGHPIEVKPSEPASVAPQGTWAIKIDAGPGGIMEVELEISGEIDDLSGTVSAPGGTLPLSSANVSGTTLSVELDSTPLGMPGTISFNLDIEGDSAEGKGDSPQGPFTLTASRTSGPPETIR